MINKHFATLISFLLLLAACSSSNTTVDPTSPTQTPTTSIQAPTSSTPAPLATAIFLNQTWRVIQWQQGDVVGPAPTGVTLTFNENQTFSGNAGCNTYQGQWSWGSNNETMVISQWMATKMGCATPDWFEFLDFLAKPFSLSQPSEGFVYLEASDGTIVLLSQPTRLAADLDLFLNQTWQVVGLRYDDVVVPPPVEATLTFHEDHLFAGNAGCNGYGGQWSWAEEKTVFVTSQISITAMLCETPDWDEFVDLLAEPFSVAGDVEQLVELYISNGPSIMLEPIENPAWQNLVGLSETKAEANAHNANYAFRVVSRDGERFAITEDYRQDRINADIVDGVVTKITVG
ncbi:MAG TPA: META domain-containing protein [Acidimicrobiia bacterium]|jgi:heat shock protein HslJ|nr:META domain-containing protein [Acidimicrobiia bacterium]HIL45984.1 META domain-containing protein [Acidimicrobiia bacterium]